MLFFQVEHGHVSDWQRFTQAQLTVVTEQWQRDKEGLLARALVTLQEATHAHQEELELHRDRQNQQDICSHLREKVSVWYTFTPGIVTCSGTVLTLSDATFYVGKYAAVLSLQNHI